MINPAQRRIGARPEPVGVGTGLEHRAAPGTDDWEDFGEAAALRGPDAVVRGYAVGIGEVRPADALSDLVVAEWDREHWAGPSDPNFTRQNPLRTFRPGRGRSLAGLSRRRGDRT